MNYTFSNKNINKLLDVSNELKEIKNITHDIANICKKYRIIPDQIGEIHNEVLAEPCGICGNNKPYKCKLRTLNNCKHTFHKKCIDNWLIDNNMMCIKCNECTL